MAYCRRVVGSDPFLYYNEEYHHYTFKEGERAIRLKGGRTVEMDLVVRWHTKTHAAPGLPNDRVELYEPEVDWQRWEMTSFTNLAQVPNSVPTMVLANEAIFVQMRRGVKADGTTEWTPVGASTQKRQGVEKTDKDRVMDAVHLEYVPEGMDILK